MRERILKWIAIVIWSLYGIIILIPVASVIGGFCVIALEDKFIKWDIDNPYVDSHYEGWKEVTAASNFTFQIPENWTLLEEEDGAYKIVDAAGNIWGYGAACDKFAEISDLVGAALGNQPENISRYEQLEVSMPRSYLEKMVLSYEDRTEVYSYMSLSEDFGEGIDFVIFADVSSNAEQYNIAEAMLYSFAFQDRK